MTDTDPRQCRKCGGEMKPSKAFVDRQVPMTGAPDFPGDDPNAPGQTITPKPVGDQMANCLKCEDCGWSVM